jgi:hypothetical protein
VTLVVLRIWIKKAADNPLADFMEADILPARLDEAISSPKNSRAADGKNQERSC